MGTGFAFALRGEGSETLELDIYDVVRPGGWLYDLTARGVRERLKSNANAKTIRLRINSEGGDVINGFAIYSMLVEHKARVEADIEGIAASVASVIAMAADEIRIASNAWMMIHNASGWARGESDDLKRYGEVLAKMSEQAADVYAARTGLGRERVLELMKAETWMTATEAKSLGFVDRIMPAKKQRASQQMLASMHLDDYENVPDGVRQIVQSARAQWREEITPERSAPGGNDEPEEDTETATMGENQNRTDDPSKAFLSTLGVANLGEAVARLTLLARLEAMTGKAGDEAHGVLLAWKQSHEELPKLSAELEKLKEEGAKLELDQAIAAAKKDSRWTLAREEKVRKLLADEHVTMTGAKSMVAEWGVVKAIAAGKDGAEAAGGSGGDGAELKWQGKTYAELKGGERHQLMNENKELFEAMRADAQDKGLV